MSKISELSDGGSLVSSDYLIAVRSGGNVKVRMDQINVDQVDLGDNEFIRLGNSQDLTMVHTSTQSIINQAGIGDLLLQKAGTTKASITANGLNFPDNSKAIFGAGSDLQIYHDGTHSYVSDQGTGNIKILADDFIVKNSADTETMIQAFTDAAVSLWYDNSAKLTTTATGIDVTGTVTADNAHVPSSGSYEVGGTASGTTAIGSLSNSAGKLTLDTDSTRSIHLKTGGNLRQFIDGATGDISFYEDTGTTPKLFWDASAESLGIGGSPSYPFHVTGSGDTVAAVTAGASSIAALNLGNSTNLADGGIRYDNGADALILRASNAERMRIDASGSVGIGTATITSGFKLEVTGDARFGDAVGDDAVEIGWSSGGAQGFIQAYDRGASAFRPLNINNSLTVDASGNVGIGTDSLSQKLHVAGNIVLDASGFVGFGGGTNYIEGSATNLLKFGTANVERMRIDASGNLLVGTTSATGSGASSGKQVIQFNGATENGIYFDDTRTASGTSVAAIFGRGSTAVGRLDTTLTSVALTSLSDERVKTNIVDAPSASDDIDAIQVRSFDWKADGSHQKYGMVAQELQTVAPEAVSAPEDPEDMMGVDYSKLVPMMLKEIQSLRARVAALES